MPSINALTSTGWLFVAGVALHTALLSEANTTEVATTGTSSIEDTSSDIGRKNIALTFFINDSVTLNCTFDSYSVKRILWWFDERILFTGNVSFSEDIANARVDEKPNTSLLHIEGLQSNYTGLYECIRGKNETGLVAYLYIKRPISTLSIVLVNGSETNSTTLTLVKNETYLFLCFGDEPSNQPYRWEIDGEPVQGINKPSHVSRPYFAKKDVLYNSSELLLHVHSKINFITCRTGNYSIDISVEVLVDTTLLDFLGLNYLLIALGCFVLIVLFLGSLCYCVFTCDRPKERKPLSCRSSIYSMPSLTSNDHADSNSHRRSRGEGDGMRDIAKKEGEHITKHLSPFDLQYVDPIVQHPTTDTYNTFERNLNIHGLQLHSLLSKDDLNEFWEATLCGGSFNGRIIVRSLSGKATMDLLEEFRKFMISVQGLPHHPNIWSVHGVSKEKLPYRICYEYHDQTTVRDYLLGNFQSHSESPHNQTQTLVVLAYQIVDAMVFLKSHAFDHVAIRTEKILLDHTEDCKLYDFNLSSQSQQIALNASREDQILPWLAPEVIFLEEYNQWTDIWAFGVVLWELWCGGRAPHCGKSRENLEKDLRSQQFLVQPPNCPGAIYSLMLSCWKNNASERKMFSDLKKDIYDLRTATESSWYGPEDYSTVGSSSFYTVLDNTYDAQ